jgi:transposase
MPSATGSVPVVVGHPGVIPADVADAVPACLTNRHRLNRGGDRQLNPALHTIVLTRIRTDPETRAYITRRLSEGQNPRETKRSLKRIIARKLFRLLQQRQDTHGPATRPLDAT